MARLRSSPDGMAPPKRRWHVEYLGHKSNTWWLYGASRTTLRVALFNIMQAKCHGRATRLVRDDRYPHSTIPESRQTWLV